MVQLAFVWGISDGSVTGSGRAIAGGGMVGKQ
jgi:hypothetical protein